MNVNDLINALDLPVSSRVDKCVPKKMLVEQGACAIGDRKQILEGIEDISWLAALKPNNIGIPGFNDDVREYLEIAALTVKFRETSKASRLIELIHRAVPYPLLLISAGAGSISMSLAHKRRSQGETNRVVVDGRIFLIQFEHEPLDSCLNDFLASIALSQQPENNLFELYQGWINCIAALEVARINGIFIVPQSANDAVVMRKALEEYSALKINIAILRTRAEKEKQLKRQVDLNLEIKQLEIKMSDNHKLMASCPRTPDKAMENPK